MTEEAYVTFGQASHGIPDLAFAQLMEAVLEKKMPFRFSASGDSMSPFIQDGDTITVEPSPRQLRPGDVVAFVNVLSNQLMVHRIVHVSPAGCLIKGDNNSVPDGLMPASSIIGRIVRVVRRGRQVRLGLGIERCAIAWLSKRCWLTQCLSIGRRIKRPLQRP
jgi:signal peptidase I